MSGNNHEDLLSIIKEMERIHKDLEFEYVVRENEFYVNIIGKKNISRVTVGGNFYSDFESIDDSGMTLLFEHIDDARDGRIFAEHASKIILIASEK